MRNIYFERILYWNSFPLKLPPQIWGFGFGSCMLENLLWPSTGASLLQGVSSEYSVQSSPGACTTPFPFRYISDPRSLKFPAQRDRVCFQGLCGNLSPSLIFPGAKQASSTLVGKPQGCQWQVSCKYGCRPSLCCRLAGWGFLFMQVKLSLGAGIRPGWKVGDREHLSSSPRPPNTGPGLLV